MYTMPPFENVWLIDDDEDDHILFEEAMRLTITPVRIKHLYGCTALFKALELEQPDLIFMDVQMPYVNGEACLQSLKASELFGDIPVIMLSDSSHPFDVQASYAKGSALYLVKPNSMSKFSDLLKAVFGLDWSAPNRITSKQYINGAFVPFNCSMPFGRS